MGMEQQQQLHRILSTFLLIFTLILTSSGVKKSGSARLLTIINNCQETVWPAVVTMSTILRSINDTYGFELKPGKSSSFNVSNDWVGTIWGRTGCEFGGTVGTGNGSCQTGGSRGLSLDSCSSSESPVKLAEFVFEPSPWDLRLNCPSELALKSGGEIVGCQNACSCLFNDLTTPFSCLAGSDFIINFCPSSILNKTMPNVCEDCMNSGRRCTYNQTSSTCSVIQEFSTNRTVQVNFKEPSSNRTVNGGIPLHNGTVGSGLPLGSKIMIGVFAGAGVFGGLILLLIFFYRKNQQKSKERTKASKPNVEQFLETYGCLLLQRYKYKDIKRMTNSFRDKLGQGGYGSVFKGKLVDGRLVAVKVLINDPKKGNGEEFMNEVTTIGRTNHINVVSLLGFCISGSKRALVYEFMPNGSLEKFIYAKKERDSTATIQEITTASTTITAIHQLGWEKLYQIALGIAQGLEYLHRGCNTGRILHFDIKPHNILLDEKFCPKISDFGLAKLCPTRESIVSMQGGGRGTVGYIAPEVYCRNFGGVSHKSDVYSYGMMVLEMVGGRKNIDPFVVNTSEIYFPHWIYDHLEYQDNRIEDLLRFEGEFEEEMARKMIMVGLWCVQTNPSNRPSMSKVSEMLEGRLEDLEMPPKPIVENFSPRVSPLS